MAPSIEIIARGVIQLGSRILLCQDKAGEYYYLPGGHVEFGESSEQALAREIVEEAGLEATIGPLVLVLENRFVQPSGHHSKHPRKHHSKEHHELNLVFLVEHLGSVALGPAATGQTIAVTSCEDHIAFVWVELAALADVVLYPDAIRAWLACGGEHDGRAGWLSIDERST